MREPRHLCIVSKLELSLVFTGLLLLLWSDSVARIEARPVDQHASRQQHNHRSLDSHALAILPFGPKSVKTRSGPPSDGKHQEFVHHETNKVILLTNGEEIKLYPLKESDLTPSGGYYVIQTTLNFEPNGWARPLISDVGYVFDDRFCVSFGRQGDLKNNCLVIFWLDRRNGFLHYGSLTFDNANRIELLSSKFNANGNLKSLSERNRKKIFLHELPPIDLCKEPRQRYGIATNCDATRLLIDETRHRLNITLSLSVSAGESTSVKLVSYVESFSMPDEPRLMLDHCEYVPEIKSSDHADAMAMTANSNHLFWLNSNHELYSSDLSGHDTQLIEKLSPRPALRAVREIRSYRDMLFFSDTATKSIVSYNTTQRALMIRQNKPQDVGHKKKFNMVEKLDSTHQVLLVETSPIMKFDIVNMRGCPWDPKRPCNMDDYSEDLRVIDDSLTDQSIRRRLDLTSEQYLLEEIMQMLFVFLAVLLVIYVLAKKRYDKQDKSDCKSFIVQGDS